MAKALVDKVKIYVKAGNGGDGHVSFRREKYIPKGGPDGGDGGNGGDVYLVPEENMVTLLDFRTKTQYKAQNGKEGGKRKMSGESGEDLYIKIPVGTLIYEVKGDEEILVGDMVAVSKEEKLLIAKGGIGGKGNVRFKSSTNQAPVQFTHGTSGEEKTLILEIKMVADVGLIGMPNAGKSTLINYWTNTKAKTASYPFTTITPNLGKLTLYTGQNVIVADLPGLIEGASQGKGLGDDFLRHIERTRILVHLINPLSYTIEGINVDMTMVDTALQSYKAIREELSSYVKGRVRLADKPEIVVINKIDITEVKESLPEIIKEFKLMGVDVIGISAVTGEGTKVLQEKIVEKLKEAPERIVFFADEQPTKTYTIDNLPNRRVVKS